MKGYISEYDYIHDEQKLVNMSLDKITRVPTHATLTHARAHTKQQIKRFFLISVQKAKK